LCKTGNTAYSLTRYTFTGQYSHVDDPTTSGVTEGFGLMFYNARYYDPALGRFAQADSIIPGGAQGLDRYAYANNNPIRYSDPSGHCFWDICIVESAVLVDVALAAGLAAVVVSTGVLIKGGRSTNAPIVDIPPLPIPLPDGPNPGPILENCEGLYARTLCYIVLPVVAASLLLKSISNGGCGEDESNCKKPPLPDFSQSHDEPSGEISDSTPSKQPKHKNSIPEIRHKPSEIVIYLPNHQPSLDFNHHHYGAQD